MPTAEAPIPESPQAESGRSTVAVGGGGLRRLSYRKVNTALSFTLLGGLLILGGCSGTPTASPATSNASTKSSTCVRKPTGLTPVTRSKLSTLPPSHDNDVGEGGGSPNRIPTRIRMQIRFPRQVRAASLDAADSC